MSAPRRYRAALRAYPASYRSERGPELLATLADGDDERGAPSLRETVALARHGFAMRVRAAAAPEGMLVAAAVMVLLALTGGFNWAERVLLYGGVAGVFTTDGPGLWWQVALGVVALLVLAVGPLRVLESRRRSMGTVMLAAPLSLAVFTGPGRILRPELLTADTVAEFLRWLPGVVVANWELTVPTTLAAVTATALALRLLPLVAAHVRQRVLALALGLLSGVAVVQAWQRPADLEVAYGQSAFADLGPSTFIAFAGLLLAMLAVAGRPRARRA